MNLRGVNCSLKPLAPLKPLKSYCCNKNSLETSLEPFPFWKNLVRFGREWNARRKSSSYQQERSLLRWSESCFKMKVHPECVMATENMGFFISPVQICINNVQKKLTIPLSGSYFFRSIQYSDHYSICNLLLLPCNMDLWSLRAKWSVCASNSMWSCMGQAVWWLCLLGLSQG